MDELAGLHPDQAFVSFYPVSGVQLAIQVGGYGLRVNSGPRMSGVRIWGYKAEPPYTGQLRYYCDGATQLHGLMMRRETTQRSCNVRSRILYRQRSSLGAPGWPFVASLRLG